MSKKQRNSSTVIIPVILGVLLIFFIAYQFIQSNQEQETLQQGDQAAWKEYTDSTYGFRISYPGNLNVISSDNGVSFAALGPGTMGVKVYEKTPFQSTDEWLVAQNAERETLRKEKTIRIAGTDALVTYYVSVMPEFEEVFPNEKRTVFLKDGDLYEIWTKFYDDPTAHQTVWERFAFTR